MAFTLGMAAALGGMLLTSPQAQAQTLAAKHKQKATSTTAPTSTTAQTSTAATTRKSTTTTTSTTTQAPVKPQATLPGYGYKDVSYSGAGSEPTADKPQSKLWYTTDSNDETKVTWWSVMYDPKATKKQWYIFKLDGAHKTWTDTGVAVDSRANTRADALWDGTHLYIATHVIAADSSSNSNNKPAYLNRYTYDEGAGTYTRDINSATITTYSSESITLDKDSNGILWATWTQGKTVYVNSTTGSDESKWGTPFKLTPTGLPASPSPTSLTADDLSSLIAFDNKIGLMWSNQATSSFYFAVHNDADPRTKWSGETALSRSKIADDHINLKTDGNGGVYAGVKTSLDALSDPNAAQTLLLSRASGGPWSSTPFGTIADCHTRPQIVIDSDDNLLFMFATGPSEKDCTNSGQPGTIYEKITSLDHPSFAGPGGTDTGRGTPVIRDPNAAEMNDVTDTKQNVTKDSGLIIMASNDLTNLYWHADLPLGGQ